MHCRLLTSLALAVGAMSCAQAYASSDDSCAPTWSVVSNQLDVCSSLPFLSPGNDSSVNLRLLLADAGKLPLTPAALNKSDLAEGYGEVPFAQYRLMPGTDDVKPQATDDSGSADLTNLLATLGITREPIEVASDTLVDGEGSRCRSNSEQTATDFIRELIKTPELSPAERSALASSRMQMLSACGWQPEQLSSLLPGDLQSATGKYFVTYLQAAADFYSGRLAEAINGFTLLADNPQPWLKDTALYMIGRGELNLAQEKAFEYGELRPERVDLAAAKRAEEAFNTYIARSPSGIYSATANGLLRRIHWLKQDNKTLADEYEAHLFGSGEADRIDRSAYEKLVREADLKLITPNKTPLDSPVIAAINNLMWMREGTSNKLTETALLAQKETFAQHPELFAYLQAAFAFYVEKTPAKALQLLPTALPDELGYLAFSQQMLRGLALQANNDQQGAQALWLQLIPRAKLPLQKEQLQLALAMNYERAGQLPEVFAVDSPITSEKVRYILLSNAADATLLRQQVSQGVSTTERNTALFVLLYKDLMRSQFADFAQDLKQLPGTPSEEKLSYSLGYLYDQGQSFALLRWNGEKAESGYSCPSIVEIAATLQKDANNPKGLNCMGEFILRNNLDTMPLDEVRAPHTLGGAAPGFSGNVFARQVGYMSVIANPKAAREDKAYALYRAINCYGPSGINGCGGKDVEPAVRKAWFKQLKSGFADTRWGKSQQYYW